MIILRSVRFSFVFLLLLLPATGSSQTSWQWVNPLPQGNLLDGVQAIGTDTLFAVGDAGTIIKSTNAGTTWLVTQTAGGMLESLFDLEFSGPQTGFAVGVSGQLVRTTDAGETWLYEQLPTFRDLLAVEFYSENIGWIVGSKGSVFSTTNAGSTWEAETTGTTSNLYDLYFADSLNGWAVGAAGTIIHSTDGGVTWTPQSSGTTQPLYSVYFVSPTVGYVSGAFGKVLKTQNGGLSWTPLLTNALFSLYKVHFTSALNGWAIGSFGSIIKTTNGGLSWFEQSSNTYNDIYAVTFISSSVGYVVGDYGTILKTSNGGAAWEVVSTGTKNIIYGVHFPNETNGFAVGEEGTFSKSSDGGYHWTEQFTGIFQTYYGVWFVDNNTGWLVGDSAVILRTTNGGVSWNDQNSRSEETLNSVYFQNASKGWAVGDFGTILGTTNGGSSWVPRTIASFASFLKIRFFNDQIGWVAGYSGEIFKTTNGGTTWVEQTSGTNQAIYDIEIIDANTVYACGDFGTLLKTVDGGQNWVLQPNDYFESFYGMAFKNATTGWAAGDDGVITMTTNGGGSWTTVRSKTIQTLFDVQLVHVSTGGILFAAGEGGTIVCSGVTPLPVRTWTGAFDSLWTFTGNWTPNGIPGKTDSVYIPLTARNPVIRSTLQQINIGAMRIGSGAKLTMRNGIAEFVVKSNVNVDGTFELDQEAKTNIIVGRDFVVGGTFTPGSSTVRFTGPGLIKGRFHNVIVGDSIQLQSVGGITIENSLLNMYRIFLRAADTLSVLNPDPLAIQGPGSTFAGTVRRAIKPGTTSPYRFESAVTYLRFEPTGTLPDTVIMTSHPRAVPPGQGDSVFVRRWYNIVALGGSNYMASLSLGYDLVETAISIDDLVLFRDSANIVVNLGATDYIDSDLVAVILDSVKHFSRWYLGRYDYIAKNQFQFLDSLILTDNGGLRDTIFYGAYPGATDGLDTNLGESALGAIPGAGTFDVRWVVPPTTGTGTDLRDILSINHAQNVYTVRLQPGPGGYPFTLRWHKATFPPGRFTLRDKATSGSQFSIDMKAESTYTVTNASITQVEIVHDGPAFYSFASGWNIISLPLSPPGNPLKTLVFPTATSSAFNFNNGYATATTLDNGIGYWLKFPNAQDVGIDGDTVLADTIALAEGWNMIGTITVPVSTSSVIQQPPNNVSGSYFEYSGTYSAATTLSPARGYWVKADAPGQIILSSAGAAPKSDGTPDPWAALSSMNSVTVTDRRGAEHRLWFGDSYPAGTSADLYELPPPPPTGAFDARFGSGRAVDLLVGSQTGTPIILNGARYPVTLAFNPSGGGEDPVVDVSNALTGEVLGTGISASHPIVLRDPAVTAISITLSSGAEIPSSFALRQNYPNPFNPTTTIGFDLPTAAKINLKIFNILGQLVRTIVDAREFGAGKHQVEFRGDGLGSGLYFYRLEAFDGTGENRVYTKKMLLMK